MTGPLQQTAHMLEDAEFLIGTGEWPERIATRLGYKNTENLYRSLYRRHRADLVESIRLLDRTSLTYQLAHYTPMDEAVARDKARYVEAKRNRT